LTVDKHRRLLDEMAEAGCFWLLFTGGEPFLRPDFLEIYDLAKERGFLITLFTNGTTVTPEIADHLAERPPFRIEISVYGRTQEVYEAVTRTPGSYRKCMRGIELLRERKLPLALKTMALSVNRSEIPALKQFADSLGLPFRFDAIVNARVDCSHSPLAVRLKPEEVVEMDLADEARAAALRELAERGRPRSIEDGLYRCGGGITAFAVDPCGGMRLCSLINKASADLNTVSLAEAWNEHLGQLRKTPSTRLTKCIGCTLSHLCGMCPANGELENGDPEKPVEFLCATAHLRAFALEVPVNPHYSCEYCPGGAKHEQMLEKASRIVGRTVVAKMGVPSNGNDAKGRLVTLE